MQTLSDYREHTDAKSFEDDGVARQAPGRPNVGVRHCVELFLTRINDRRIHGHDGRTGNGSFGSRATPRDGSSGTEATLLSVLNIPHYPPRCALTTLSRAYLACVIIRLSSWRTPVYCLLNFHSFAMIASDFVQLPPLIRLRQKKKEELIKENRRFHMSHIRLTLLSFDFILSSSLFLRGYHNSSRSKWLLFSLLFLFLSLSWNKFAQLWKSDPEKYLSRVLYIWLLRNLIQKIFNYFFNDVISK